jgi:hypothetical protein
VIVDDVRPIQDASPFHLFFNHPPRYEDVAHLGRILASKRGQIPVILNFADGSRIKTGSQFWIDGEHREQLAAALSGHFGEQLKVS